MAGSFHLNVRVSLQILIECKRPARRQCCSKQHLQQTKIVRNFLGSDVKAHEGRYQYHKNNAGFGQLKKIREPAHSAHSADSYGIGAQTHPENCSVKTF